jgi:hypothetical protein
MYLILLVGVTPVTGHTSHTDILACGVLKVLNHSGPLQDCNNQGSSSLLAITRRMV